jgi:hypothetical protein
MTIEELRAIEVITHHIVSKGLNDALVKLVDQLQKESGYDEFGYDSTGLDRRGYDEHGRRWSETYGIYL